ncbi:MAG: response regulator [Enterobacteriaceae bacterium]
MNSSAHLISLPPWSLKILVVDDVDTNLALLRQMLNQLGQQVTTASSGQEALTLGRQHLYDLLLLDMIVPDMDGQQILQRWRNDLTILDPNCPVFVLSAVIGRDKHFTAPYIEGFDDQIPKPVTLQELSRCIQTAARMQIARDIPLSRNSLVTDSPILDVSQAELMERLSMHLEEVLESAKESITSSNWYALKTALHTIKGSAGMGGLSDIANEASRLEKKLVQQGQLILLDLAALQRMVASY